MNRLLYITFLCATLLTSTLLLADIRPDEMKVKISGISPQTLRSFDRMGFLLDDYFHSSLYLRVTPAQLEQLRKMGYEPEIVIGDMNAYRQEILSSPDYVQYHDYNSTLLLVDSLISQYPNIIEKHNYGLSVQGRQLYAVKISDNVSIDETEPEISFDGCHHGDEIMGAEIIIRLMRDLCVQYGNNPQITNLVDNREIWIYPFINPDGRQALDRLNTNMVDINRDWGYMWDHWGGSTAEFSQPETQAAASWIIENQFVASQSDHGGDELLSYPWSYRPTPSPDDAHIDFIAGGYAGNSGYTNLPFSQGYSGLYPINGSAKDNFFGIKGSVGWTLEVSNNKTPPASAIATYYGWNKPAMLYLIEMVSRGVKGMVTDANSSEPVRAIVWVDSAATEYWPVYTDPQVGDFHKFLLPGTYDITITANGYQTMTVTNVTIVDTGATEVNFQLQKSIGINGYQVIASQIPNNNFADEGMTPWALGAPDNRNYSIGRSGWVVLDMGTEITDYPGNDLRVVEGDASPEGYSVLISDNWLGPWNSVGSGVATAEYDVSAAGLSQFRYVRIEDDGDGSANVPDAGFDLDAVEGRLIPPTGPYLLATGQNIADSLTNFNGILEAGETAHFDLIVQNFGVDLASNMSAKLSTSSQYLSLLADSLFYGDMNAGGMDTLSGFIVQASPNTPYNADIEVIVNFSADNGYEVSHPIKIRVQRGAKIYTTENQIEFDPTFVNFESVYPLKIFNQGPDTLFINSLLLATPFFSTNANQLIIPPSAYGTIDLKFTPGDTILYTDTLTILNSDPINFEYKLALSGEGILEPDIAINVDSVSVTLQETDSTDFILSIENIGAGELTFSAKIVNYSPPTLKAARIGGGADAFGHVWSDSDDPNGPQYNWTDISDGSGTAIAISGSNMISNVISTGFSVPFYSDNHSFLRVCTNGWLSFTTYSTAYNNTNLPDPSAPRAMLAPLWDNLVFQTNSSAYYRQDADKFIVQWDEVYTQSGYGPYTFEAIIYDNGDILLQYENLNSIEPAYTLGMQNGDASDGFAIAFDENYLHDQMAIMINRRSWVKVSPTEGQISPGGSEAVHVQFRTDNFAEGDYWAGLKIDNNDPDQSTIVLPIHMKVSGVVGISEREEILPDKTVLYQNFPNPFNPNTTITFQIPEKAPVKMAVYNPLGQLVKSLLDKELLPGEYRVNWDATNEFGQAVPSGIYFYQLRTKDFSQIKKMILLH